MSRQKKSFFERLTGTVNMDDEYYEEDEIAPEENLVPDDRSFGRDSITRRGESFSPSGSWTEEGYEETHTDELPVDVYQSDDFIIIKSLVPGVRPEDLDVSITRESVTISGKREGATNVPEEDYFHKELYWGPFARSIVLPQEIEIEGSEASEKHGLLVIKLAKLNKDNQTRLKVKSG